MRLMERGEETSVIWVRSQEVPLFRLAPQTPLPTPLVASVCVCMCVCVCVFSCFSTVGLFVAHQSPLSMVFSRQEYWSGLPFPSPRDLPDPGIQPVPFACPALAARFLTTGQHL